MSEQATETRNTRKTLVGKVRSDKMDKTIVVRVERRVTHPLYGKIVRRHTTVYAHDDTNDARMGDLVEVMESRPLSKTKRFRLVKVLRRAPQVG